MMNKADPMRVAVLTVSDRSARGEREDRSGPEVEKTVGIQGWRVVQSGMVPDEREEIEEILRDWSDSGEVDLILTTGGTGFSPRDQTPEATLAVIDRVTPGIAEAMRARSLKITPHAMLSRAVAGIRGRVLIVNLPGNPKAAVENLEVILPAIPHAIQLLQDTPDADLSHRPPRPSLTT